MHNSRFLSLIVPIHLIFIFSSFNNSTLLPGQEEKQESKQSQQDEQDDGENESTGSTVKGRLVQAENKDLHIDLAELNATFDQLVKLPSEPLPDSWKDMTPEQRQQWVKDFESSDKGQALAEKRKQILESAASFKIQVEENGDFVIYDVPQGTYGLRGRIEKSVNDKNYVFEVFGQVIVSEKVEEVLLDPITVTTTRLIKNAEQMPGFKVETFDGKREITDEMLKGQNKNVLISFWALESPPSLEFAKTIQKAFRKLKKSHKLHLVSICIASDRKKALQHVKDEVILGWHGYASSWEDDVVNEFGVRVIPAMYLVDPKGKMVRTHNDFRMSFQVPNADIETILVDALEGKPVPTPEPAEAAKK